MSLTRHEEGSFRELWSIALPLMVSSLSVMSMVFVDRIMLAHYSTAALNAAVTATTLGWCFIYAWLVLTSISEVFVAQYNGAGKKNKLGEPVWQMIWLSLASILFFVPLALWGGFVFHDGYPDHDIAQDYFMWMMIFGPSYPLYAALCGFFVGQGKTKLITLLAIGANIMNAGLDMALIFGVEGWIPSLGPRGAAIATSGSSIFQDIVLFAIFLSRKHRSEHGSTCMKLQPKMLWQCIKIGLPSSIFVGIEVLGWAMFYWMMTLVSETYITIAGICQSVVILLYFFAEGVSKAATTVSGNLIGAKKQDLVPKVFMAGFKMNVLFLIAMLVLFFGMAEQLAVLFLPQASLEKIDALYDPLLYGLLCMVFYMFFEGLRLLLTGLLTAAGDTVFLFYAGSLAVWALLVIPVYFFVVVGGSSIQLATSLCVFYSCGAAIIYFLRFSTGQWRKISIMT